MSVIILLWAVLIMNLICKLEVKETMLHWVSDATTKSVDILTKENLLWGQKNLYLGKNDS